MVQKHYDGDRPAAQRDCIDRFVAAAGLSRRLASDQSEVLEEMALIARSLNIADAEGLRLLAEMVEVRPRDVYRYQRLLSAFLRSAAVRALS
jgi:hypothetical protein